MFSFFRKKSPPPAAPAPETPPPVVPPVAAPEASAEATPGPIPASQPKPQATPDPTPASPQPAAPAVQAPPPPSVPAAAAPPPATPVPIAASAVFGARAETVPAPAAAAEPERRGWLDRLRGGLRKTGASIAQVFSTTTIDDALYEELEAALLMADAGVPATQWLLDDLRRRVRETRTTDGAAVKGLLVEGLTALLAPLEGTLVVGRQQPTVMMVVGVNGAGKTTSIGKLTRHLSDAGQSVLLAAGDTFRAAAREQLAVWADRADAHAGSRPGQVEIVSQAGGDPAAVVFDAVKAGAARGRDVVIADTAGRLPTQLHLMEELRKIQRVIGKAMEGAPHEVLLVVDGNTGQNALAQVKAFDTALGLTGLIVTKLDGTAKGGVLAAIALWSRQRKTPVPVYFVGVGEQLADLQTFRAREFAQALLG